MIPFRSQPLVFFGEISYCMYMVDGYLLRTYDARRGPVPTGDALQYAIRAIVVLGTSVIVCVLSLHLIERPVQSLRKYVLRKK